MSFQSDLSGLIKPLHGLRGAAAMTIMVGHLAPAFLDFTPLTISKHLSLLQDLSSWERVGFNMPSWSISVEFFVYGVFAVSLRLISKGRVRSISGSRAVLPVKRISNRPSLSSALNLRIFNAALDVTKQPAADRNNFVRRKLKLCAKRFPPWQDRPN